MDSLAWTRRTPQPTGHLGATVDDGLRIHGLQDGKWESVASWPLKQRLLSSQVVMKGDFKALIEDLAQALFVATRANY